MLRGLLLLIVVVALALIVLSMLRRTPNQAAPTRTIDDPDEPAALPPPAEHSPRRLSRATAMQLLYELAFDAPLERAVPAEQVKLLMAVSSRLQIADAQHVPPRPPLLLELVRDGNGTRSLAVAALVQPLFRAGVGDSSRFAEIVWERTQRAAAAAEAYAAVAEGADSFAAPLAAFVMGLGAIVVYRAALEHCGARNLTLDPTAAAALLEEQTPKIARRVAVGWGLPERVLEALDEQQLERAERAPSSLGRSLRFGLLMGALSVLCSYGRIDEEAGLATLRSAGGEGERFDRLWERLTWPPEHEPTVV